MQITPTNRQTGLILRTDGLNGEVVKQVPLNFQSQGESVGIEIEYCLQLHWGKFRRSPPVQAPSKRFGSPTSPLVRGKYGHQPEQISARTLLPTKGIRG